MGSDFKLGKWRHQIREGEQRPSGYMDLAESQKAMGQSTAVRDLGVTVSAVPGSGVCVKQGTAPIKKHLSQKDRVLFPPLHRALIKTRLQCDAQVCESYLRRDIWVQRVHNVHPRGGLRHTGSAISIAVAWIPYCSCLLLAAVTTCAALCYSALMTAIMATHPPDRYKEKSVGSDRRSNILDRSERGMRQWRANSNHAGRSTFGWTSNPEEQIHVPLEELPYNPRLRELESLPLEERILRRDITLAFKIMKGLKKSTIHTYIRIEDLLKLEKFLGLEVMKWPSK